MNHEEIVLENVSKMFEFEKISRDLDSLDNIKLVKNFAKCYAKLYLKQQEIISKI